MDDEPRIGDWIQIYSGGCFWPLDPRPEDVSIIDIARALSMTCRYGGHVLRFYSVAEHSVLVSQNVPPKDALWGLLHDAAEAYSADIPRPLKQCLPDWKPMEARIMRAVCQRFGLPPDEPESVTRTDLAITTDERLEILTGCDRERISNPEPLGVNIKCYPPEVAERLFLSRFAWLTIRTQDIRFSRMTY